MAVFAELERRKLVRLRARPDLNITPQKYEGKTCYVVKDPVGLKYYRFNEQEYFVVQHFNGKFTLEETQKDFETNFRPHRLTLEDLEGFAQQLLTAGLVQHETPQAGKELFSKQQKQRRMQKLATWTNVLYIKIPIFDPDKILKNMLKWTKWIFTSTFFALSLLLMVSAVFQVLTHYKTFYEKLPDYQMFFRWNTLLYMWIALGIVKVIHEFGHGLSCKAFGGECHEMGALFLCFSPCLYCNVSDAWTIPSKWKRICISFAGIYVELVIAALATWVWWYTPGRPLVNNIAMCVMVLCSVSTFVFNANPLMRFDGYYIMADWLEIPNLRDRCNRTLSNMTQEHLLGIEVQPEPYMEAHRMVLFLSYAVVSWIYRWVVTFGIILFLKNWLKPHNLESLSTMLAVAAVGSMVIWPTYRFIKNYRRRGRLPDMKRNRVLMTSTAVAAVVALFFLLPLPISRIRQAGVVQLNREAQARGKVTVPEQAILKALHVRNGERVYEGKLLAEFRNPKLDEELAEAATQKTIFLTEADSAARKLLQLMDPDERKQAEADRVHARNRAEEAEAKMKALNNQIKSLNLLAPCNGIVMEAPKPEEVGKLWEKENPNPFCTVGDLAGPQVIVPVDPDEYQLLRQDLALAKFLPVTMLVPGRGMQYATGKLSRMPETDAKEVPVALTHPGGGPLAVKNPDPNKRGAVPQSQQYLIEIDLSVADPNLLPGTMVQAKIQCRWITCGQWTWRKINALFDLGLM